MLFRPVVVGSIFGGMPWAEPGTFRRFPIRFLLTASVPCGRAGKSTAELDRPPALRGVSMKDLHGLGLEKVPDDPLDRLTPEVPDLRVAFVHCFVLPLILPWAFQRTREPLPSDTGNIRSPWRRWPPLVRGFLVTFVTAGSASPRDPARNSDPLGWGSGQVRRLAYCGWSGAEPRLVILGTCSVRFLRQGCFSAMTY